MFSLIITVIAVLLTVALSIAALYYGGSTFTSNGTKANAARVVNEGQQLQAAVQAYRVEQSGAAKSESDLLSHNYITTSIKGWGYYADYVASPVASEAECLSANALVHVNTVPDCSDSTYANKEVCCKL